MIKKEDIKEQNDKSKKQLVLIFCDKTLNAGDFSPGSGTMFSYDEDLLSIIPITQKDVDKGYLVIDCEDKERCIYQYRKTAVQRSIKLGKYDNLLFVTRHYVVGTRGSYILTKYKLELEDLPMFLTVIPRLKQTINEDNTELPQNNKEKLLSIIRNCEKLNEGLKNFKKEAHRVLPWIILLKDKYKNGFGKDTRYFIADGKIVNITDTDMKNGFISIKCDKLEYIDTDRINYLIDGKRYNYTDSKKKKNNYKI